MSALVSMTTGRIIPHGWEAPARPFLLEREKSLQVISYQSFGVAALSEGPGQPGDLGRQLQELGPGWLQAPREVEQRGGEERFAPLVQQREETSGLGIELEPDRFPLRQVGRFESELNRPVEPAELVDQTEALGVLPGPHPSAGDRFDRRPR